jgi:hypothetical protein
MTGETGPFARRVGSRVTTTAANPRATASPVRIWGLRLLPTVFVFPILASLVTGIWVGPAKPLGLIAGVALLVLAGELVRRGLDATADYDSRRFAAPPPPFRLVGALAIGLGFFFISLLSTNYGFGMSLLFAALGTGSAVATYGLDPSRAKQLDRVTSERTGVKTEQVVAAIREAERKLEDIRLHAASLANRELKGRIDRILDRAHGVLDELERDPKDLPRARRFLNVYLDGTRNVIRDYAKRQQDFAETSLAQNFTSVLGTIETVFEQQLEHLKKDEVLDLEVAIEVLETQLTKEGVG